MSETRRIRTAGEEIGEENLRRLMRMLERGELDQPVEFWSVRSESWQPISGIMNDFDERDRVAEMRDIGIKFCKVIGAGHGNECPACAGIQDKRIPIADAPKIPPEGCTCIPWCRCCVISVQ